MSVINILLKEKVPLDVHMLQNKYILGFKICSVINILLITNIIKIIRLINLTKKLNLTTIKEPSLAIKLRKMTF